MRHFKDRSVHNGSLKSLEDVVEFYNRGVIPNRNLDEKGGQTELDRRR